MTGKSVIFDINVFQIYIVVPKPAPSSVFKTNHPPISINNISNYCNKKYRNDAYDDTNKGCFACQTI